MVLFKTDCAQTIIVGTAPDSQSLTVPRIDIEFFE